MKSWPISGLLFALGFTSGAVPQTVQPDPLGHRLKLSFFEYAGAGDGQPKIYFSRFKGILRDKLSVLVEELPDSQREFDYLQRLSLEPPGEGGLADMLSSEAAVQQYWDQSRSLLLFRGVLSSDAHDNFFAQSRIYLGSLRGDPLHPSVAVRLPIHSDDFPTTSDTHSLIVYYALAKDAQRIGDDRAHIIELLSRAQDKISDLKKQSPLAPNMVGIEKDIKHCLLVARGVAANP